MRTSILVCLILLLSTSGHAACPTADLTGDCFVGLADLAVMAGQWEGEPNVPLLYDMASQWLTEGVPDDPENLVWVYIDDSGAGMTDEFGNPISNGGFTGEMSKYETTNAQYAQYLTSAKADGLITVYNDRVYATDDTDHSQGFFATYAADSDSQITYSGGVFAVRTRDDRSMANHPVVVVSWYGATAFCNYYGYRLPTEWEWQAVADCDGSFTYGCGTTIDCSKANYNTRSMIIGDDGDYCNPLGLSSYPYTSPANYYRSYGYGMNDMAGNVWEWTNSIDRVILRVIRGGCWALSDVNCAVSFGGNGHPGVTHSQIGFRVCR